jgi:hypothetical protein
MTHGYDYERALVANILRRIGAEIVDSLHNPKALLDFIAGELTDTASGSHVDMLTRAISEVGGGRLDDESLGYGSYYTDGDLELSRLRGKLADVDEGEVSIDGTEETIALTFQAGSTNYTAVLGLVEFEDLREGLNSQARERALEARSK